MSVAIYISIEQEIPDFDSFVNGKAIAHLEDDELNDLCAAAGVKPVWDYMSQDPEEAADFLEEEGVEVPEGGMPPEQWYAPEEGLAYAQALITYLQQNPDAVSNQEAVLEDVQEYEHVFLKLLEQQVRWHFALDF